MGTLLNNIKTLVIQTVYKAIDDDITLHGAALAFYTIFSLVPILVIIIFLAGFFLGPDASSGELARFLEQILTPELATTIEQIVEQTEHTSSNIWTYIIASGALLFGATTVISQLKQTLNTIWKVELTHFNTFGRIVLNRVSALVLIILISFLFLGSLLLEGIVTFIISWASIYIDLTPFLIIQDYNRLLTILIGVFFFAVLFKFLPDVKVRWRDIFIGAVVTTALFWIGKFLVGTYLTGGSLPVAYRAAGSFVIFLIWMYYNSQIVLIGAEFTQIYTERFGGDIVPSWNAEMVDRENPA